jgi:hypothetical protein
MDMDIDKEIEVVKKLIPSAIGEKLTFLNRRLTILLQKKEELEKSKQPLNPVEEDIPQEEKVPPSLPTQENTSTVKIIKIDKHTLYEIFLNRDGIKDFMNKCLEHMMSKIANDQSVLKLIKAKCYLQVKVVFEYYHNKSYEPTFKSIKRSFYVDKIIQRSDLVQTVEDLRRVAETQLVDILHMMDNFEHQGSDWVIVKPVDFKFRLIRYKSGFKRARGFIPTPAWLNGRRAIINIQNKDENCFFKCIYR